jgi:hypothetical protein
MRHSDPGKAVRLLDALLQSFGENGEHWIRGRLDDGNGSRCLIGAIDHLYREQPVLRGSRTDVGYYIAAVNYPRQLRPYSRAGLMAVNDLSKSFDQLRAVLVKARALAQRDIEQPGIVAAEAATDRQKRQEAEARKRQLLAALERERMQCRASLRTLWKWRQPQSGAEVAADLQKRQEAEARKRQLLAEIERERMKRHAAGDMRETYILSPRAPALPAEPQRLAA